MTASENKYISETTSPIIKKEISHSKTIQDFINLMNHSIPNDILKISFGIETLQKDSTQDAYKSNENSSLLARTFKSDKSSGIESELSFLENEPGFIFANPTTVISTKIPSRTISQLPGLHWSDQPSLLFSVQPLLGVTIADCGIASLNSFSSTDAMNLMRRLDILKKKESQELTISEKLSNLKDFLEENWRSKIDDVKKKIDLLENKTPAINITDKRFYKPYELFFHKMNEYDELIVSLETLVKALNKSNKINKITNDIEIKDTNDNLTTLSSEVSKYILKPESKDTFKKLFFQATEQLKKVNPPIASQNVDQIYEKYCEYLDSGARHNELVSRVYPWEITGIEWGKNESKEEAVADLITIVQEKFILLEKFNAQGIEHPLFTDFMINKLSFENPWLNYNEIKEMYKKIKIDNKVQLDEMLNKIKNQLQEPVCIYEYYPDKKELKNISSLLEIFQNDNHELSDSEKKEAKNIIEIFEKGIKRYEDRHIHKMTILPKSFVKKRGLSLNFPDFTKWKNFSDEKIFLEILQTIAKNIINQPYVDDKRELLDSDNNIIYRPNHDVTHSIRQMSYIEYLLNIIKDQPQSPYASVVQDLTSEELFCIKLAAFICRSGRTNEKGSREDSTNLERSANIFYLIAKDLGFDEDLIINIKHSIKEHIPLGASNNIRLVNGFKGDQEMQKNKTILVKLLLDISHDADLVRCNSWKECYKTETEYLSAKCKNPTIKNFKFSLIKQMKLLLNSNDQLAEEVINDLLLIAKKSCELTGTPVHYNGFTESEKVMDYDLPIQDEQLKTLIHFDKNQKLKDIKSKWTNDISGCYSTLRQLQKDMHPALYQSDELKGEQSFNPQCDGPKL